MKRSEVNKALRELEAMCEKYHCYLPPFCHFTPDQWQNIGHEYDEVRDCMLGWDITDYGLYDFDKFKFSLITIRNGNRAMEEQYSKVYAEKLRYMKREQLFGLSGTRMVQNTYGKATDSIGKTELQIYFHISHE